MGEALVYLIQLFLLIVGGYCLYVAYQLGYHPFDGIMIAASQPASIITEMFENIFDVSNVKQLKQAYLGLGAVLVLGCGGVLFVDIGGGSKSSDD